MAGGLEGYSSTGWRWPGSALAPKRQLSKWEGQRDVVQKTWRLLTTPGVSAMTRSDSKNKVITGWVNGRILCSTREVTDLLGSEQLKASERSWVHWRQRGGWDTVCLLRGKGLETRLPEKWVRDWKVRLGRWT